MALDPDFELQFDLDLDEPDDAAALRARTAELIGVPLAAMPRIELKKRAIDARRGRVRFHVTVGLAPAQPMPLGGARPREVGGDPVIVVGGGPAGLFCAYELARAGVAAIVLDRGKQVQARRRDLKGLTQHGRVDPDSNYCFGEGGAGIREVLTRLCVVGGRTCAKLIPIVLVACISAAMALSGAGHPGSQLV